MQSTRLCLVRHGETAWNAEGRVQGQLDIPLNATGLAQARAVAAALKNESFAAIYSSDLVRAQQTARPVADLWKKNIVLDENLRERHYGMFQGMTYAEASERIPEGYARFKAKDPGYDFGTGESLEDFNRRSLLFIKRAAQDHEGENLLLFTHGGVLEMVYRHATGRGLSTPRDFEIPNAGINRVEIGAMGWRVESWADIDHLSATLDDLPG
jgi:probable phosphoglycerate mutase